MRIVIHHWRGTEATRSTCGLGSSQRRLFGPAVTCLLCLMIIEKRPALAAVDQRSIADQRDRRFIVEYLGVQITTYCPQSIIALVKAIVAARPKQ